MKCSVRYFSMLLALVLCLSLLPMGALADEDVSGEQETEVEELFDIIDLLEAMEEEEELAEDTNSGEEQRPQDDAAESTEEEETAGKSDETEANASADELASEEVFTEAEDSSAAEEAEGAAASDEPLLMIEPEDDEEEELILDGASVTITPAGHTGSARKWSQGSSRWKSQYSGFAWSSACAVVAIADQIAYSGIVGVDLNATSFNSSTMEGFNPATFAKAGVSKGAFTSGASVSWTKISKVVPGFVQTYDTTYHSHRSNGYSYFPVSSKYAVAKAMATFLNKGYYPIIEGGGSSGGAHYVAVISATYDDAAKTGDVLVADPNGGGHKSLFDVNKGKSTQWTLKVLDNHGYYSGYGSCVLYKVNVSTNKLSIKYNANGGVISSDTYTATSSGMIQKNSADVTAVWNYGYGHENGLYNASTFGLTRSGYRFGGWSLSKDGSSTVFDQDDGTLKAETIYPNLKNGSATVILYAQWAVAGNYIDQCTFYPAYLTVKTTGSTNLKSLPCSVDTDSTSKTVYASGAGETFTATGLCVNTAGNIWYCVNKNGTACYLSANTTSVVSRLYSDVTISGAALPSSIEEGEGFPVTGEIKSAANTLTQIDGYILRGSSTVFHSSSGSISTKAYSLEDSAVDTDLQFGSLDAGSYTLKITAQVKNNYAQDSTGKTMGTEVKTVTLAERSFNVTTPVVEQTYTVTFNANGGTDAPAEQTKVQGAALMLPRQIPTRTGYTFLGWSTSKTAAAAAYQPGSNYMTDANAEFYAVWQTDVPADTGELRLTVSNGTTSPGGEVELTVSLKNNPGIGGITCGVAYDTSVLELKSIAGQISGGTWSNSVDAGGSVIQWYDTAEYSGQTLAVLTFKVREGVETGSSQVTLSFGEWDGVTDVNGTSIKGYTVIPGTVTIAAYKPGDINSDGSINIADVVRLAQYIRLRGVGVDVVKQATDVNGDGSTNIADVVRLAQYIRLRGVGVEIH